MTEQQEAAKAFCATVNHNKEDEFTQDFMWADNLGIDTVACSIENGSECEACGS